MYCKDSRRHGSSEHESFIPRLHIRTAASTAEGRAQFTSFSPTISRDAPKKISAEVRSWRLHQQMEMTPADIARWINPEIRGWVAYYGPFGRSQLYFLLRPVNT